MYYCIDKPREDNKAEIIFEKEGMEEDMMIDRQGCPLDCLGSGIVVFAFCGIRS